jgi:FAD/FMN-containing dehydrogenase
MDPIAEFGAALGPANVLTGADMAGYATDWTGRYVGHPIAVLRPGSTEEVSLILRRAEETGTPVVPVSGNTGLNGGTKADGALMVSLERMNRIREIRPDARIAIAEAGVVLSALHDAAEAEGLKFPVTFGARGSAMLGGILATNAGGSNVLRYGNTRALCLGLEAVLPGGEVLDLMTELHKDNSGYDLRDLLIGAEGTLGIITAAVLKLVPLPGAYATALVAVPSLPDALSLLNRLQQATGGAVEAFEYMPKSYIEQHAARFPDYRLPLSEAHEVNILVEVGAVQPRDVTPGPDGAVPVVGFLAEVLGGLAEAGQVLDAVVAQNEDQRRQFWALREAAAEVGLSRTPIVINDIAVPVDRVSVFLERMAQRLPEIDAGAETNIVSHLGDGNVHYVVWPASQDPEVHGRIMEDVEEVVRALGGSFSAEHGIGISKKPSMARRKDKVALSVMRRIKTALDPKGIMNPGKVLP